ncbi:hypothetical protein SNK04_014401 [Fusarium graminearum]
MSITDGIQCACSSTDGNATLADLRKRLMIRLGFAAQANNPPPGMKELLNDLLQSAQVALFRRPTGEFRNVRWFSWPLTAGQRLYDYPDNDEKNGPQNCPATLDPRQVTWVGRERDGVWAEMHQGINPRSYTTSELTGLPQRYEFRNCIEIWPAPDETLGNLVIKGKFDLNRFTEDADKTTIDSEIVFLLALANGKQHYRQPDAQTYIQQLEVMISTWLPARMPRRGTSRVRRRARACMSRRVLRCRSRDRPHRHPQRGQGRHQPSAGQGRADPSTLYDLMNGYVDQAGVSRSRPGTKNKATLPTGATKGMCAYDGKLIVFSHEPQTIPASTPTVECEVLKHRARPICRSKKSTSQGHTSATCTWSPNSSMATCSTTGCSAARRGSRARSICPARWLLRLTRTASRTSWTAAPSSSPYGCATSRAPSATRSCPRSTTATTTRSPTCSALRRGPVPSSRLGQPRRAQPCSKTAMWPIPRRFQASSRAISSRLT